MGCTSITIVRGALTASRSRKSASAASVAKRRRGATPVYIDGRPTPTGTLVSAAGLITGHFVAGWRGRLAVRWTLAGFTSLLLAYVGSKIVLELILRRA